MDETLLRLECLKLASCSGVAVDKVESTARAFYDFVRGDIVMPVLVPGSRAPECASAH